MAQGKQWQEDRQMGKGMVDKETVQVGMLEIGMLVEVGMVMEQVGNLVEVQSMLEVHHSRWVGIGMLEGHHSLEVEKDRKDSDRVVAVVVVDRKEGSLVEKVGRIAVEEDIPSEGLGSTVGIAAVVALHQGMRNNQTWWLVSVVMVLI